MCVFHMLLSQATETGDMDRISQLPDFIVHHILSFFDPSFTTPAELVRMSVLSKTWFHLTASFLILVFNIHDFFRSRERFFKYVEYTTSRFCHQNDVTSAHTLRIIATILEPAELDIINRCLELLLNKCVKEFWIDIQEPEEELNITNSSDVPRYRLPNTLLSVSMLTSLTIHRCELPSSLMLDAAVKFKSLIRLSLLRVQIDDEVIKYLAASCPLLQVFWIRSCHGFKRFCVHGHQHLQEFKIYYNTPVEIIDIEAPNLSTITVRDTARSGPPQMNMASCKKLTSVDYIGHPLPNSNGFLSSFPFVEDLCLEATSRSCKGLKLSSHSLRTLGLHSNCDLEKIELSAPNLGLLVYTFNRVYLLDKIRQLSHLKACMRCYLDGSIDPLWFQKLRFFLDKKNGFKVFNLYIHAGYSQKFTELEKLKAIELPPYELEHIELHFGHEESSDYAAFVDAVLCCFCPRSLTLRPSFGLTDFKDHSDLVKFTYKKLLEQEGQGRTNIQIVSPYSSKAQKQFRGLMLLPFPFLSREEKAISFIKEEGMS